MKWEYLCVRIVDGKFLLIDGEEIFEYATELCDKPLLDVLKVLGHDGWKLVTIEPTKSGAGRNAKNLYFKRPLDQVEKWEYSVIGFRGEICSSVDLLASDAVLMDMKGFDEETCLIRMGNRGWELVSVVVEYQNQKKFYFKRLKQ